jgi:hypothetical protein
VKNSGPNGHQHCEGMRLTCYCPNPSPLPLSRFNIKYNSLKGQFGITFVDRILRSLVVTSFEWQGLLFLNKRVRLFENLQNKSEHFLSILNWLTVCNALAWAPSGLFNSRFKHSFWWAQVRKESGFILLLPIPVLAVHLRF